LEQKQVKKKQRTTVVWRHCGLLFKPVADFPLENLILAENKLITNPQRQAKPRDVSGNFTKQNVEHKKI
jgi:hypothetical protein